MGPNDFWFYNDCGNDVAFDSSPRLTKEFMKELLIMWLHLPTLEKYVFDEGDPDSGYSGDELQYWGYFRLRRRNETGIVQAYDEDEDEDDDDVDDDGDD